jgi:adenylosuccinate synthase
MANTVVLGMQWGDEGKGKIVDLICPAFDAVIRFQGGHNAGHTVKFGDRHFALHFLPSGIIRPEMPCVLGNGMVIDPEAFFAELGRVQAAGVETGSRLFLSNRAHIILPSHVALDQAREEARGAGKIGTTTRGIGPTYESKAARGGRRVGEPSASGLEKRTGSACAWPTFLLRTSRAACGHCSRIKAPTTTRRAWRRAVATGFCASSPSCAIPSSC